MGFGVGSEETHDAAGYSVEGGGVQLGAGGGGLLVLALMVLLVLIGLFVLFALGGLCVMLFCWFGFILDTLHRSLLRTSVSYRG